ncbi:ras-like GTP-binding protein Rho1 [Gordionus sp. m RMFG-2023]|uniref:ras-like GTP-binding protein Rho1 n=1 Tax=Gordionus sp. m RMFG-2023 TaxID=3053472 RepID=UPI0031FD6F4C
MKNFKEFHEKLNFKILFVGDSESGKTCLIDRIIKNSFNKELESYKLQINVWDTPGSADCDSIRPLAYADTDLVMLCFSVVSPQSLESLRTKWIPEINSYCPRIPLILIGCKSDLRHDPSLKDKTVTYSQASNLHKSLNALTYIETSAVLNLLNFSTPNPESCNEFSNFYSMPLQYCPDPISISLQYILTGIPKKILLTKLHLKEGGSIISHFTPDNVKHKYDKHVKPLICMPNLFRFKFWRYIRRKVCKDRNDIIMMREEKGNESPKC